MRYTALQHRSVYYVWLILCQVCKICYVIVTVEGTFATLPRTARGVAIVLGGDPKGKNFLYTNGNSVIIRDIAV